jgi:predicted GNAT family acetyltransferase
VARLADVDDRQLLVDWTTAFHAQVDAGRHDRDPGPLVDIRIAHQRAWLWESGGEVVSYVGVQPMIAGVVRVGPVYTPPARRGRGYASALVAHASQHALDNGATTCSLYTDLANPTSNKIYAAIGYEEVADVATFVFTNS